MSHEYVVESCEPKCKLAQVSKIDGENLPQYTGAISQDDAVGKRTTHSHNNYRQPTFH